MKPLPRPIRPLTARPGPRVVETWHTQPQSGSAVDQLAWCRIYHHETHTPNGHTGRPFGPLHRFDHHETDATGGPQVDPDGRTVLYLGEDLLTCANEVCGEAEEAPLCPGLRVARVTPLRDLTVFDLQAPGAARAIGALPSLGSGNEKRELTQEWARAIQSDRPVPCSTGSSTAAPITTGSHWRFGTATVPSGRQPTAPAGRGTDRSGTAGSCRSC